MGMVVGSGKGPMADPNVVPFIDVLLVLLIIFMVITPLTPKGLEALVPQPPPPGAQADAASQRTQRSGRRTWRATIRAPHPRPQRKVKSITPKA